MQDDTLVRTTDFQEKIPGRNSCRVDEFTLAEINHAVKNYRVFVWTVNVPDVLHKFIQKSCVSGIVTDYPAQLAKSLGSTVVIN